MRDTLTAIGGGATMVGLMFLLASRHTTHGWLLYAGEALAVLGVVLFIVRAFRQFRS